MPARRPPKSKMSFTRERLTIGSVEFFDGRPWSRVFAILRRDKFSTTQQSARVASRVRKPTLAIKILSFRLVLQAHRVSGESFLGAIDVFE